MRPQPSPTYLDNAATSFPKPDEVYQGMDRFLRECGASPGRGGYTAAAHAARAVMQARQKVARFLGAADARRVIWTSGCTAALNLALKGLLHPGDTVVATHLEHNAVARPLRSLEAKGVRLVRVPCPAARFDCDAYLRALEEAPALAVIPHASNVTGEVLPLAEVGAACRALGVPLLVDAAQTAGALPVDVAHCSLLAIPGHKGLFGPPGIGALWVGPEIVLEPLIEGGTGSQSEMDRQPDRLPERFESGTLNTPGIVGLDAGVTWVERVGREVIHAREQEWTALLWEGLGKIDGVHRHGPPPGPERAAVVSFTLGGWAPTDLAAVLDEAFGVQCRAGLHCAPWAHVALGTFPSGTVRLSPGYFNTEAELERALDAVRQVAGGG